MHLQTTTMDPRIARIHYADYRKRVAEHREERRKELEARGKDAGKELGRIRIEKSKLEKEDEQLLQAYRALARGQQLINIKNVVLGAGFDHHLMPKLAITKADAEKCHLYVNGWTMYMSHRSDVRWTDSVRRQKDTFRFRMPNEEHTSWGRSRSNRSSEASALVPMVPPHLRPKDLSKYYILWEAEWERKAPVDPVLLSRVNDTMFAVVAQWDLTPLEQQVLEGRFGD